MGPCSWGARSRAGGGSQWGQEEGWGCGRAVRGGEIGTQPAKGRGAPERTTLEGEGGLGNLGEEEGRLAGGMVATHVESGVNWK